MISSYVDSLGEVKALAHNSIHVIGCRSEGGISGPGVTGMDGGWGADGPGSLGSDKKGERFVMVLSVNPDNFFMTLIVAKNSPNNDTKTQQISFVMFFLIVAPI
ncbi:MAG TPA: hypothetical protein VMC62_05675 [Longilinea sp.]|nr:hypothetical protein [Longilinea sp.]